jgi:hypothetical protein
MTKKATIQSMNEMNEWLNEMKQYPERSEWVRFPEAGTARVGVGGFRPGGWEHLFSTIDLKPHRCANIATPNRNA